MKQEKLLFFNSLVGSRPPIALDFLSTKERWLYWKRSKMFKVFNGCLKNIPLTAEDEKKINSFIFKRYISNNIDGLMFCSYINSYDLSNEALYEYFRCIFKNRKITYIPYTTSDKKSDDIEFLKKHYNCNDRVANDYLAILSPEQIKELKKNYNLV